MKKTVVLGIDIGGSGIKGAPVDTRSGELVKSRFRITTPQPATPKAVAKVVGQIVKRFDWDRKIGCGFPAAVRNGVVQTASNIDAKWIGTNASVLFKRSTGCRAIVVNDADAAGLAEMRFGAGQEHNGVVVLVTVGTGLGTAVFSGGVLVPNTELGHLVMNGRAAELAASDAARQREDLTWPEWADRFNDYLQYLERLFWPDLFIIGGGASKKHRKFIRLLDLKADVVEARLLNEAGIVGAALAAELRLSR